MRRWGILVSAVYLFLLYLLFIPLWSILAGDFVTWVFQFENFDWDWGSFENLLGIGSMILPVLGLLLSQAVLFVSVDRSFRRPIPRSSLKRIVWATALATGLLTAGALMSLAFAIDTAWKFQLIDSDVGTSLLIFSWIETTSRLRFKRVATAACSEGASSVLRVSLPLPASRAT